MSEKYSEESEMYSESSTADSRQMREWSEEIADLKAESNNWKDRVSAVAAALKVEWGRAKSFYYGEARRIDGFEKDAARSALQSLRAENDQAKLRQSLIDTARHLERTDQGRYGATIAALRVEASRVGQ